MQSKHIFLNNILIPMIYDTYYKYKTLPEPFDSGLWLANNFTLHFQWLLFFNGLKNKFKGVLLLSIINIQCTSSSVHILVCTKFLYS